MAAAARGGPAAGRLAAPAPLGADLACHGPIKEGEQAKKKARKHARKGEVNGVHQQRITFSRKSAYTYGRAAVAISL